MYLAGLWLGVETLPFEYIHSWSLLFPRSSGRFRKLSRPPRRCRSIQPLRLAVATREGYHRSKTVTLLLSHNQTELGNAKLVPRRLRLSFPTHHKSMMSGLSNEADECCEVNEVVEI